MDGLVIEGVSLARASTGQQRDPCVPARAAGYTRGGRPEDSAKCVLQPEIFNPRPATSDHEKRFRKVGREPGIKHHRHFQQDHGNDAQKPSHWSGHGKPSSRSESVGAVMQQGNRDLGGISDARKERREARYESNVREPLGKGYARGHQLPTRVSEPGFRFGQPTGAPAHHSGQSGKDVILPTPQFEDTAVHEQYVRSHYAFAPGEQMQRRYAWPSEVAEDPAFRFGSASKCNAEKDSVGGLFGGGAWSTDAFVKTKIVEKNGEDYRQAEHDHIGKPRSGSVGRPPVPPGFAFGMGNNKSGGTAGEAIKGNYTPQEQLPDQDLGRCMRAGRRNVTPNPQQVFGKPSGLPRAYQRSASVSTPSRPSFQPPPRSGTSVDKESGGRRDQYDGGVALAMAHGSFDTQEAQSEMLRSRCKDEVRGILKDARCTMDPAEFHEAWNIAACSNQSGEMASIDSFAKAYAERQAVASVHKGKVMPARVNTHARVICA